MRLPLPLAHTQAVGWFQGGVGVSATQVLNGTCLSPPSPHRAPWRLPGYRPPLPMHWPMGTRRSEALAQWCPDCICRRYKLRRRSGHAGCAGEHGAGPHVLKYGTGSPSHSSQTVPQTQVKARACKARTRHGKCAHVQGVTAAWRTAAGWGPRSKPDLRTKPPWHQRQGPNTEESRGSSLRASDLPGGLSTW